MMPTASAPLKRNGIFATTAQRSVGPTVGSGVGQAVGCAVGIAVGTAVGPGVGQTHLTNPGELLRAKNMGIGNPKFGNSQNFEKTVVTY